MTMRDLCDRAFALYQRGNIAEAEKLCAEILGREPAQFGALYLLGVIRTGQGRADEALELIDACARQNPGNAEILNLNGVLLQQKGRHDEALACFDAAVQAEAGNAGAWYNRAALLQVMERRKEALASFDKALALAPDYAEAHNNRGVVLQNLNRSEEALAAFDKMLSLQPRHVGALYNRAITLAELQRPDAALANLDAVLRMHPDHATAWRRRGLILQGMRNFPEALSSYDKALALQPEFLEVQKNIASALCESGHTEEGFAVFRRHAERALAKPAISKSVPAHKARHDAEQRRYLADRGAGDVDISGALHLEGGSRVAAASVNPDSDGAIAQRWQTGKPQLVVIDDLLGAAALAELRRFCWGSTIWRRAYEGGYLGALPELGFACPLLAQIADDLRTAYPAILGPHPLHYLWGFKYDSDLAGIKLHADKAAVNVNFWITPDESNLDPGSGGLVVWDVAAPQDWSFRHYNGDTEASRDFLRRHNAKSVTIPYRANRAVIFDSDLFHETDRIAFRDGYLDRRINVTMLYGRRTSDNR